MVLCYDMVAALENRDTFDICLRGKLRSDEALRQSLKLSECKVADKVHFEGHTFSNDVVAL